MCFNLKKQYMETPINIQYTGLKNQPSDYGCGDGELAESVNLISENGELRPIISPEELFEVQQKLLCVHKINNTLFYIVNDNGTLRAFKRESGINTYLLWTLSIDTTGNVLNVNVFGNTLIFCCDNGIFYVLFKKGNYITLGNSLPDMEVAFSLDEASLMMAGGSTWTGWHGEASNRSAIYAKAEVWLNEALKENKFSCPFFVRFAYRLFDGSISYQSSPVLMIPRSNTSPVAYFTHTDDTTASETGYVIGFASSLMFICLSDKSELSNWSDIIKSIDIFVSDKIYTHDSDKPFTTLDNGVYSGPLYEKSLISNDVHFNYSGKGNLSMDSSAFFIYHSLQKYNSTTLSYEIDIDGINSKIKNTSVFYLLSSVKISDIPTTRSIVPIKEGILSTIATQEQMTDDYISHSPLYPLNSFTYNERLNLLGISKSFYNGFSQNMLSSQNYVSGSLYNYNIYTIINFNREKAEDVIVLKSFTSTQSAISYFGNYLYYPDTRAYRMIIERVSVSDGTKAYFDAALTEHPSLNGSYYFPGLTSGGSFQEISGWSSSAPTDFSSISVSVESEKREYLRNKIFQSVVDNPFLFEASGVFTVGTGSIIGMATVTQALSQGQFGAFPLYLFSTDGIWTLELASTGLYSSKHPVVRDVCNNANSITQIDGAIVFTTDRGLMMLSGSSTTLLSEKLNGKSFKSTNLTSIKDGTSIVNGITGIDSMIDSVSDDVSFIDYIKDCRISYDYARGRLFIINENHNYQYIYSLKYDSFGKIYNNRTYNNTVNNYPDSYIQTPIQYNLVNSKTIMTGADFKTVGATWTTNNVGMKFEPITYNANGTSVEAAKDKLILSIYDESPYIKNSIHSALFSTEILSVLYNNSETANIRISAISTSWSSGVISGNISFASNYSGTDFSVSGNTLTANNAAKLSITGNFALNIIVPSEGGEPTFNSGYISMDGGNKKTTITSEMISWDSDNYVLGITVPVNFIRNMQSGETDAISYNINLTGNGFANTLNIGDGGEGITFSSIKIMSENILKYISFSAYSDSYFTASGEVITLLRAGVLQMSGTYIIQLSFTNLSGSITPSAGSFIIGGSAGNSSVSITTDMWSVTDNMATITIPFDVSFGVSANDSVKAYFNLFQTSVNEGGILSASIANFSSVITESETEYSDGINFVFEILNSDSTILHTSILNKTAISSNFYYLFSLDFEDIFTPIFSQVLTFKIYNVLSGNTKSLITTTSFYYLNNSVFLNSATRVYSDMPFYEYYNYYNQGGAIYNISSVKDINDITDKILGFSVSRPLTFGDKNILKTIKRIENRGYWDASNGSFVKISLYGSRDLINWYKLKSLRGFSFKYFRIVYYTRLSYSEALTGTSFVVEARWQNKIR